MQQENRKIRQGRENQDAALAWDRAIAVAKRKIKNLQASIRAFEIYRDSGEPWPGADQSEERSSVVNDAFKADSDKARV